MKNDDDFIHLPELYLKLGTLKKHLNNIYNLNINSMENSTKNINFKALEQSLNVGGYDDERMAMISCDIILEYAVKLDKIVMEDTELEEWVKSKISKTEQMMASVKHGLIGIEKYDHGGEMFKKQLLHIAKYAKAIMEELEKGVELMSWMESNLAICADYLDNVYHHLDYKMGNRAKDLDNYNSGMPTYANGGGVDYTDYESLLEEERRLYAEYNKAKADYNREYKEGEFDSLLAQEYKQKMEILEGKMMEVNNDLLYLQTHGIEKSMGSERMANGGGVGFSVYENVYIPSLYKMGSPADSSGMVINIFTENGKEMLAIELKNGKSIKIRASKVEKKYANGGGVGNQGLLNKNYLDSIPAEKKAFILKGIAEHYGISVKKVLEEVTSSDAEELADYIMGRGALEVFNAMKSMKMTNGGNMMAAQGMFLDGEFEETVRKVKDYISKYPYVWKNGNKSYVPIEGWQYAASLMGLSARVTEVYAVPEKNGWMAKAEVVNQTGVIVCSGFGFVGRDEEKWAKSTESDLESFSQTKAVSRALRNCISYLIKAAGYSTTPAEEMYGLKGSSKSMNSKKPNLRPIYGVPDIDGQIGPYDMPVQKPIEKASTEERSNISILLQKVWAESKGRGIVLVSPEFMQKIEDNLFDLDATSLSFEVLLADAYDWMIENNVVLRSKIFMKEIQRVVNNLGN